MRSVATRLLCVSAVLLAFGVGGGAQQRPPDPADPRVGLKAGLRDAGTASRNMELVSSLPKPDGFFDPKNPAGDPTPPERGPAATPSSAPAASGAAAPTTDPAAPGAAATTPGTAPTSSATTPQAAPAGAPPAVGAAPAAPLRAGGLDFANSDLAFSGTHMFMGNFNGFNTYDIESAKKPKLLASVVCPGGQGDVSVYGHLLFMSVEQTRGRIDCGVGGVQLPVSPERFRGVRIFDISDLRKPR